MGVNAAVVGLLLAALYDPVWTSAVASPEDFAQAAGAFALLAFWKWPQWLVVLLTAAMAHSSRCIRTMGPKFRHRPCVGPPATTVLPPKAAAQPLRRGPTS